MIDPLFAIPATTGGSWRIATGFSSVHEGKTFLSDYRNAGAAKAVGAQA
ncbi:MAG TPA: hypothetical protein P5013_08270 [Methanoregula sp.]|nr:hypothetical protein [Methanoregula sp.]